MRKLRLASYNVHKCVGPDGYRDPSRVIAVLNALGADIVALQEVDRRMGARAATLSRSLIEAHTDFVPVAAGNGASLGFHGNAVLLRRGQVAQAVRQLALPGFEPRGALLVDIGTGASGLRVVAAHLGLMRRHRHRQLGAIREFLTEGAALPTAILGDFNEWSLTRGFEALDGQFSVHAPGRSFHALSPMGHLDRIALSPGIELGRAGVHDTGAARRASDHLPVWADVRLVA